MFLSLCFVVLCMQLINNSNPSFGFYYKRSVDGVHGEKEIRHMCVLGSVEMTVQSFSIPSTENKTSKFLDMCQLIN